MKSSVKHLQKVLFDRYSSGGDDGDSTSSPLPYFIEETNVEVLGRPAYKEEPLAAGYDIVWPMGSGDRKSMTQLDTIFLTTGKPQHLREDARVYLLQGEDIFWSAPVLELLSDSERVSEITGRDSGPGPILLVGRGKKEKLNATKIPASDGKPWYKQQNFRYVTPGCKQVVLKADMTILPKTPKRPRSSVEVALELSLARHIPVDIDARRIRIYDNDRQKSKFWEVDICAPTLKLVVEYDGWWHQQTSSLEVDTRKSLSLREAGLRLIRVREDLRSIHPAWDVEVPKNCATDEITRAVLEVLQRHGIPWSAELPSQTRNGPGR